jgi:rare lipoprotein A
VRVYTPIFGAPQTTKTSTGKVKAIVGEKFSGSISYYGPGFHGKKTASGALYDQNALTCAHKTLPFGSKVKVNFLKTQRSVILTVNDRGPYAHGRVLDVSVAAAKKLGMTKYGHGKANIEIVD